MLQEDSNGEATFEFVEKKSDEMSSSTEKPDSLSSVSSSASLLTSPISAANVPHVPAGNLLSNVPPPSALPSFIAAPPTTIIAPVPTTITSPPASNFANPAQNIQGAEPFYPTTFSPAIPPSKGIAPAQGMHTIPPIASPVTEEPGSSLFGWVKGAVSSGSLLSKVAEKAKHSVDSMITTLDPQMREYIYSGGDMDIIVASAQEVKISAVREAFQQIFGKATVSGIHVQASNIAAQPVGFAAGIKAAEERIQAVFNNHEVQHPLPVIAVENFLLEVGEDKWYDLGVILLKDPANQINLQTFTQMTPVPSAVVTLAQDDTPADYPLKWSGYSVTIGRLMGNNLQVSHTEWHQALTGVPRRDIILLAAKTLAGMYKNVLKQG